MKVAKHAIRYYLTHRSDRVDMLNFLIYSMARRDMVINTYKYDNFTTEITPYKDYNIGLKNTRSQSAHQVYSQSKYLHEGKYWTCFTKDGYKCGCTYE